MNDEISLLTGTAYEVQPMKSMISDRASFGQMVVGSTDRSTRDGDGVGPMGYRTWKRHHRRENCRQCAHPTELGQEGHKRTERTTMSDTAQTCGSEFLGSNCFCTNRPPDTQVGRRSPGSATQVTQLPTRCPSNTIIFQLSREILPAFSDAF